MPCRHYAKLHIGITLEGLYRTIWAFFKSIRCKEISGPCSYIFDISIAAKMLDLKQVSLAANSQECSSYEKLQGFELEKKCNSYDANSSLHKMMFL